MTPKSRADSGDAAQSAYYGSEYGYPGLADYEASDLSLANIMALLRRRWEIVLLCVVLGLAGATAWGHRQVKIYTATAQLLIEPEHRVVDLDSVVDGVGLDVAAIATQLNLLKSRGFIEEFVESQLPSEETIDRDLERLKDGEGKKQGRMNAAHAAETPAPPSPVDVSQWVSREASKISGNLAVSQEGRSFIINVSYSSTDPRDAAKTANDLAVHYIHDQGQRRRDVAGSASVVLEQRLKELEAELLGAEEALHQYRSANPISTTRSSGLRADALSDIASTLAKTRAARKDKEVRLAYMRKLKGQGNRLDSLTEVLSSPYIASLWEQDTDLRGKETELRIEFGDSHPRIIAVTEERQELRTQIDSEVDRIIANAENELDVLISREASLKEDLQRLSDDASKSEASTEHAEIKLRLLEGKADANRRIYEEFLLRFKQTREQEAIVKANTRIVAPAKEPTLPSNTSLHRFLMIGFLGSSAVGFGLAYLLDKNDRRLRNGKEIEKLLGVPCLGRVPFLSDKARNKLSFLEYVTNKPISHFAESFRSIYTQVVIGNDPENPKKVFQVTSTLPNEGKTTFAINLATTLALDGKRVLLLDLDLRNPSVCQTVELDDVESLAPFLRGKSNFSKAMRTETETGCHVMAIKSAIKTPSKTLQSRRLKSLIEAGRKQYDYVIIDGPPSMGLSDSKLLLQLVDSLIFIIKWNSTGADQVAETVQELKQCNAQFAGAVFTQVDLKKQKRYGYRGIESYYSKDTKYYKN